MKNLSFLLCFLSLQSFAHYGGMTADGGVFFKTGQGDIAKYAATLFVPTQGVGNAQLTIGDKKAASHGFRVEEQNGRSIFTVVFLDPLHTGKRVAYFLRGTYLRGTNVALYYGDIFAKGYQRGEEDTLTADRATTELYYVGGFGFRKQVE